MKASPFWSAPPLGRFRAASPEREKLQRTGALQKCRFGAACLLLIPCSIFSVVTADLGAANSVIRITADPLLPAKISPLQYGQFVEYLCDLVPSMWAEKLYDGSFEGLTPYKMAFIRETDFKEKPWHPIGAMNRGRYSLDRDTKINGDVSKRIEVPGGAPCTLGIAQDGIFVDPKQPLVFRCWLKAERLPAPIRVTLRGGTQTYATSAFQPGNAWKDFEARLTPSARDTNATLAIEFRGPATIWIDQASLLPLNTVGGWRPDVVDAVRALKPGVIRFGGSALDDANLGEFNWKDTIGDPDRRKPFRAWGGLQKTGPGLEEFVQFCRAVNAEPLICVRVSKQTPKDAAEEVEYFNGAASTPMGAWRARNGHPEPYRIKFWQVGNELSGPEYDRQVASFCAAIKAVDPAARLFSSFPSAGSLDAAGQYFDFVCPHHYSEDLPGMENDIVNIGKLLREHTPGRNIKIAVTEWNTTAGDWGTGRAKLMTLANALACSRYHNLLHRHADLVEIANRSNLINSFGSGVIHVDNHHLYKTPTYYAQELYATVAGDQPLRIEPTEPGLDLSATLSTDGRKVLLFAVNDSLAPITRVLDLSAFPGARKRVILHTLEDRQHVGEPDVRNDFANPARIAVTTTTRHLRLPQSNLTFPPLSLSVLEISLP